MLSDLKKKTPTKLSWDVAVPTTILTTIEAIDPEAAIQQALAEIAAMNPETFKGKVVASVDRGSIRVREHGLPLPKLTGEITEVNVFSPGDASVGISDFNATISGLGVDANDYEPEALQEFRDEIELAFCHLWGEKVEVTFDQEYPQDEMGMNDSQEPQHDQGLLISTDGGRTYVKADPDFRACWEIPSSTEDNKMDTLNCVLTSEGVIFDLLNPAGEVVGTSSQMATDIASDIDDSEPEPTSSAPRG